MTTYLISGTVNVEDLKNYAYTILNAFPVERYTA